MAAEPLEIRMARLEGAYQQINERLNDLRLEIHGLRAEVRGEIAAVRSEIGDLRKQLATQFYWLLTFVLGSILIPILRDLAR